MKRLLIFFALLLIPSLALAGWNIKQNDDGSTVWIDEDSNTVPVGDAGLTVRLTDLSTSSSAYVVSHKSGKLKKIYATTDDVAETTLTFHISDFSSGATTGPTPVSTGATIAVAASAGGDVFSVSPAIDVLDGSTVDVEPGDVIIVHTDGNADAATGATITYIIE